MEASSHSGGGKVPRLAASPSIRALLIPQAGFPPVVRELASARMRHSLASKHSEAWCYSMAFVRSWGVDLGPAKMRSAGKLDRKKPQLAFTFGMVEACFRQAKLAQTGSKICIRGRCMPAKSGTSDPGRVSYAFDIPS